MCDYSLHYVKSRPAKVGDKLTTRDFGTGTRGFAAPGDASVAVCVLPGTELSFADDVTCLPIGLLARRERVIYHKTAIFRQINKDRVAGPSRCAGISGRPDRATDIAETRPAGHGSSATGIGRRQD